MKTDSFRHEHSFQLLKETAPILLDGSAGAPRMLKRAPPSTNG